MVFPLIPIIGALAGHVIGALIADASRPTGPPPLDASGTYSSDEDGIDLKITKTVPLPPGTKLIAHALGATDDRYLKSRAPGYIDSEGDFQCGFVSDASTYWVYLPYGAVESDNATLRLRLSAVRVADAASGGAVLLGQSVITVDWKPAVYSAFRCARPILELLNMAARIDGSISSEEVRFIKDLAQSALAITTEDDLRQLRDLLKIQRQPDLQSIVWSIMRRFPHVDPAMTLEIVVELMHADDSRTASKREFCLRLAEHLGVSTEAYAARLEKIALAYPERAADCERLGVATVTDIKAVRSAYRRLRSELHPDRIPNFDRLPVASRMAIQNEFNQVQMAYDRMCNALERQSS